MSNPETLKAKAQELRLMARKSDDRKKSMTLLAEASRLEGLAKELAPKPKTKPVVVEAPVVEAPVVEEDSSEEVTEE